MPCHPHGNCLIEQLDKIASLFSVFNCGIKRNYFLFRLLHSQLLTTTIVAPTITSCLACVNKLFPLKPATFFKFFLSFVFRCFFLFLHYCYLPLPLAVAFIYAALIAVILHFSYTRICKPHTLAYPCVALTC